MRADEDRHRQEEGHGQGPRPQEDRDTQGHGGKARNPVMPNEFIGQNGAAIHENTDISVTGCAKAATVKKKPKKQQKHKGGKK